MPAMTLVFPKEISAAKEDILRRTHEHLYPGRVERLLESGIDFVPGRREGYRYWDVDGRELLDVHLNGGTFSLGHRNPELVRILTDGLGEWDVGNHHFGSGPKAELAQALVESAAGSMKYVGPSCDRQKTHRRYRCRIPRAHGSCRRGRRRRGRALFPE